MEDGQDQSINYLLAFVLLFGVMLSCGVLSLVFMFMTTILSVTLSAG
jgi:hypothetical protein